MRALYLLGSGISVDANMPSVGKITSCVVGGADDAGQAALRHTDGSYYFATNDPNHDLHRRAVDAVLELLSAVRARTLAADPSATPDYEELAYLLQQVKDAITSEYENPAVLPFADQLCADLGIERHDLAARAGDALDYIADTVVALIRNGDLHAHDHLAALIEACQRETDLWLVTLNHDLLMESALKASGLPLVDGFAPGPNPRFWADSWPKGATRLLKLHGSIDWYHGAHPSGWPDRGSIARRDQRENPWDRPTVLTGSFSKILAYQTGIFPDLQGRFHQALAEATRVVAIGYGFRDKAINGHLIRWMGTSPDHRLVLCHPDPDAVWSSARPAIQRISRSYADRIDVIPQLVAGLQYSELEAATR